MDGAYEANTTGNSHHTATKRVVIVDDSRTMRLWLRHMLQDSTRLHIVGEAANAQEARAVIKRTNPDVVTLDIEMPGMNGLAFLDHLMRLNPIPVVMVSSATRRGSNAAVKALSLGAVDCLVKPTTVEDKQLHRDLVRRVYSAACSTVVPQPPRMAVPAQVAAALKGPQPIVLIGASTGGVAAIERVLSDLHPSGPPVVIVQHMPGPFLASFSQMLNTRLPQDIKLLHKGESIGAGQVRLAKGAGKHSGIVREKAVWKGQLTAPASAALHCPSVDALFASAADFAKDVIAVQLTGLGRDGACGMKSLRLAGAHTICQDAATSVVYGMPRAAWDIGAARQKLPLDRIGPAINDFGRKWHRGAA